MGAEQALAKNKKTKKIEKKSRYLQKEWKGERTGGRKTR